MNMDLIDKALKPLDEFISREAETIIPIEEKGLTPVKVDRRNFHELPIFSENSVLAAIDGGNSNILGAPNFSLDLLRVGAVFYKENKRIGSIKKEFFLFVTAKIRDNKTFYSFEAFGDDVLGEEFEIDSELETIEGEKFKIEACYVAGVIRRICELKLAEGIIRENNEKINLVIDGSIKAKTLREMEIEKELLKNAKAKGIFAGFLSKTSRLLTKNSAVLSAVLNDAGPKSSWLYNPVFKSGSGDYLGEMYFVKLNAKSDYVFQLELGKEIANESKERVAGYILSLANNSNDPVFLGYPYALVDADKLARVSNKEAEYLKTVFLSKIKNKDKLRHLLASADAHSVLDKMEF
jgi:hypothetical protein